jgi:hypothetical protein
MPNWEETFVSWAKGPGDTEKAKCENAETAIRKAIAAHPRLSAMDITIFPQGSYRHKTNVRADSDVDICARLNSTFFTDYPEGKVRADFGHSEGSITFAEYKNLIQAALEGYFGGAYVSRGDKAFNIHENTYRVDSDVVPALEHRRYRYNSDGSYYYNSGIGFDTDKGKRIVNWPEQNYTNNLAKHEATGKRFRKVVRILKRLRNKMTAESITAADGIASCLIEHLVYNVPDENFGRDTLQQDVRNVLAYTFNKTLNDKECENWIETNGLEWLFRGTKQPWTREKAHGFLSAAWDYLGLV